MATFDANKYGPQIQRYHYDLGKNSAGEYPVVDNKNRFKYVIPPQFLRSRARNIKLAKVMFVDYYGAVSQDVTMHGDFGSNTFTNSSFLGVVNTAMDAVYVYNSSCPDVNIWFENMVSGEVLEQFNTDPTRIDINLSTDTTTVYIGLGEKLFDFVVVLELMFTD